MLTQHCTMAVRTWAAMCSHSEAFLLHEEPIQRNESTTVSLTAAGCVVGLSRNPHILTQSPRKGSIREEPTEQPQEQVAENARNTYRSCT